MSVTLYRHQQVALDLLRLNDGFALFAEQGTGKTFPVLFRIAELARNKRIGSALVVAPKAVCASWTAKMELLSDEQLADIASIRFEVVSYDLVWRRDRYVNGTWDCVVLDESHYIKSPTASRTKGCIAICSRARYRYIMTGTPTSNGQLCNLWSQFAAIDPVPPSRKGAYPAYPACLGGISYYKWLDRVAYLNQWHQPYKYRKVDEIQEVMAEMSYRITKAECLDLPEKLPDEIWHVEMDSKLRKPYRQMMRESAVIEFDTLAKNALTRSLRLRQMCSGYLDTENGDRVEFGNPKVRMLSEYLDDYEKKLVVFCDFRHSIDAVTEMLSKKGIGHVVLDGRTKDADCWKRFQEDDSVRVIVCQYQSGAAGIDLYAADTIVFFEPCLSSNLLEQARDRIHRVGQTRACSYIFMLMDKSIEWAIYNALRNYQDFGEKLFAEHIDEYVKGEKL